MNNRSEAAVSTIIGAVLLVGITVTLGTAIYFLVPDADPPEQIDSTIRFDDRVGQVLEPVGGDPLSSATTKILVETGSGTQEFSVADLGVGDDWDVGERICIVGSGAGCLYPSGTVTARILVVGSNQVISSVGTGNAGGSPTPMADLQIAYNSTVPASVVGVSSEYRFDVSNAGTAAAAGFTIQFDMDSAAIGTANVAGLAAGATTQVSVSWVATSGAHSMLATADSLGTVAESNEANNQATHDFTPVAPMPELRGAYQGASNIPVASRTTIFTFNVTNDFVDAGTFDVLIELDDVTVETRSLMMTAGQTQTIDLNWSGTEGAHIWNITLDSGAVVAEVDESNNVLTHSFTATPAPDPSVTVSVNGARYLWTVASADMDLDGDYDIIAGDIYGDVYFVRNDAGTLTWVSTLATGEFMMDLVALDLYGDATPEVISLRSDGAVDILTFQANNLQLDQTLADAGYTGMQVQAVDVDQDGDLDLVTALAENEDDNDGGVFVYKQNSGMFGAPFQIDSGNPSDASALVALDANGDGHTELMHGDWQNKNNGERVLEQKNPPSNDWKSRNWVNSNQCESFNFQWTTVDFDKDGDTDVLMNCGQTSSNFGLILSRQQDENDWAGLGIERTNNLAGGNTEMLASQALDYDLDGDNDIVATDWNGQFYFYEQTSSLAFARQNMTFDFSTYNYFYSLDSVLLQLDADPELEIVFVGYTGELQIVDGAFR